ncbi:MAG: alpha/beta hydrolase [Acidobacteriaceae bacterium]
MLNRRQSPWIFLLTLSECAMLSACAMPASKALGQSTQSPLASYEKQFHTEKISRDGFDLYYRSLGVGQPVLILSGGPGDDCDYMLPVAAEIAKHAHAILLEQRGTGRSIPPVVDKTTVNLALYLQDFEALRTHLNIQQWTVVGHSAGGVLAMDYAAAFPDRINKLILLDSAPVAFQYLAAFQDNMLDRLSPEERDQMTKLQNSNSPEDQESMGKLLVDALFFNRKLGDQLVPSLVHARHGNVGYLLGTEITAPGYNLRSRLKNFEGPVLVLNGRQDPMDPLMAYETSAAFKNSTLEFIDRAGHFPWFERPKEFDDAIDGFLQSK